MSEKLSHARQRVRPDQLHLQAQGLRQFRPARLGDDPGEQLEGAAVLGVDWAELLASMAAKLLGLVNGHCFLGDIHLAP